MDSTNRKKGLAATFIIIVLALPFMLIYYLSTDFYKERSQSWRGQATSTSAFSKSGIRDDLITLVKNEKVVVGRTCLVYTGLKKKKIRFDLYLLDLDLEQPYPVSTSKSEAKDELKLGGVRYKLVSVNDRVLKLRLLGFPKLY